jgi:hypothetical protein
MKSRATRDEPPAEERIVDEAFHLADARPIIGLLKPLGIRDARLNRVGEEPVGEKDSSSARMEHCLIELF